MKRFTEIAGRRLDLRAIRFGAAICIVCAIVSAAALAKDLAEYQNDVSEARKTVLKLIRAAEDSGDVGVEREFLVAIRQKVPETERIEWNGTIVETDNRWLHESLKSFEQRPANSADREQILNSISNRLYALGQRIGEISGQQTVQRSKDEDKNKLAEILRREEFQKPAAADQSLFQKILTAIRKWLSDLFPEAPISPNPTGGSGMLASILQIALAACVIGGIGFLIYRFAPLIFKRKRRVEHEESPERFILGEKLAHGERASDIFRDAERLALEGNIRGAIRKGYIALLCELSDRKIIGLARHKTNRDYLRDVRSKQALYQNINGMTSNFERHWYGFDPAGDDAWREFKSDYQRALSGRP